MIGFIQAFISGAILLLFGYCVSFSVQKDTWQKAMIISLVEIAVLLGTLFCVWDGLKSLFGLPSFFVKFKGKSKKKKTTRSKKVNRQTPKKVKVTPIDASKNTTRKKKSIS